MPTMPRTPINDYDEKACKAFRSAEKAWFWYCKCAGRHGLSTTGDRACTLRPCTVDDIYLAVSKLYSEGKIGPKHIEVLLEYGRLSYAPDPRDPAQNNASRFWEEAMDRLKTILVAKGIVIVEVIPRRKPGASRNRTSSLQTPL